MQELLSTNQSGLTAASRKNSVISWQHEDNACAGGAKQLSSLLECRETSGMLQASCKIIK